MSEGFFNQTELAVLGRPEPRLPQCGRCGLYRHCQSPKMPVVGKGRKQILVVGEAPGEVEDREGKPFIGPTGQLLQEDLRWCGIDLFNDCWVTNAIRCRPGSDNQIKDQRSIQFCRPYLLEAMRELKPVCVILLGLSAVKSLIGHLWKEDIGIMTRWAGWRIPCQRYNCWIHPTFHPSYVKRNDDDRGGNPVVRMKFREHLFAASKKVNRPWKVVPDYAKEVQVLTDPNVAAEFIQAFTAHSREVAFDYETDRLKPDAADSEIVCCSISDGATTIAYPWRGATVAATKHLLANPRVAKIASNAKFEERWTLKHLKMTVKNWGWDTMLAAHALDSRGGIVQRSGHGASISSVKFQAFILFGQEDYSIKMKPFLESKDSGGNSKNRIRKADLYDLLQYCGTDSKLEYMVAQKQKKEMGL